MRKYTQPVNITAAPLRPSTLRCWLWECVTRRSSPKVVHSRSPPAALTARFFARPRDSVWTLSERALSRRRWCSSLWSTARSWTRRDLTVAVEAAVASLGVAAGEHRMDTSFIGVVHSGGVSLRFCCERFLLCYKHFLLCLGRFWICSRLVPFLLFLALFVSLL